MGARIAGHAPRPRAQNQLDPAKPRNVRRIAAWSPENPAAAWRRKSFRTVWWASGGLNPRASSSGCD